MAKINDKFKKDAENFAKKVESYTKFRRKTSNTPNISTKNMESEITNNTKRFSIFTGKNAFKTDLKEFDQSGIQDTGINQDALDNKNILYNTDTTTNAPRKMRRIVSSDSKKRGGLLQGQNKIFSNMFRNQSKMMSQMHAESLAVNSKYQNESLKYIKNISEQVEQMNKMKSNIQLDFYKNSTTTQSAILEELKTINKTLKTGFNLNDRGERVENRETTSLIKTLFSGGSLKGGSKRVLEQLAREAISGANPHAGMALAVLMPMLQQQGGFKTLLSMGAKQGLTSASLWGASKVLGNRGGRQLGQLMSDPGQFFETLFTAWGLSGKGIKGWIGKRLGRQGGGIDTKVDLSKYILKDNKGRAAFDNAAHTALTRVITRSLANIEASLTGKAAMYYNYATNRFETLEEAEKSMRTGYSSELEKGIKEAKITLMGGRERKEKNQFGGGEHTVVDAGIFGNLNKLVEDSSDSNSKFIKDMLKYRGPQLADSIMKLVLFFAESNTDPGALLDTSNLSISFLVRVMYPKDVLDNASSKEINTYAESADHLKRFLEAFRDLPTKEGQKIWQDLLRMVNETRDSVAKAADKAFAEAEGGVAHWAAYTYGEVYENGKMRGSTREELDKKFSDINRTKMMADLKDEMIDLTGVMNKEQLDQRLKDEYNRMLAPLFKGTADKIKQNLKRKAQELKKKNHPFAEYMEKTAQAFERGENLAFENVDYAELAGITSWEEVMEGRKGPKFDGTNLETSINSAKEIAKWHMNNNSKVRGAVGIAGTAGYAALIKQMYQSTGMTGPFASSVIGITAAATAVLSGKMTKVMDVMATDVGDEKMKDKDGNETDITKRQAMQEAMYKEFLPEQFGRMQGAKIGGWIRNNIRFGPILGPVVGMTTGFVLGKSMKWMTKLLGAFGKFGKNLLNRLGKKVTGNQDSAWGDMLRDGARKVLGLNPVGSQFTMKEVMAQVGDKNATSADYANSVFTGQKISDIMKMKQINNNGKSDFDKRYYQARAAYFHNKNLDTKEYTSPLDKNGEQVMTAFKSGSSDPLKPMRTNVLKVRILGGHLDAVGVVGAIDADVYKSKLKNLANRASSTERKENDPNAAAPGGKIIPTIVLPKYAHGPSASAAASAYNEAEQFMKQDPEAKDEAEDQDTQEEIEEENKENIEKIAKDGGVGGKKVKKEKKKKKGFFGALWDVLTGKGDIGELLGSIPSLIPMLLMGGMFWPQIKEYGAKFLGQALPMLGKGIWDMTKWGVKGAFNLGKWGVGKVWYGINPLHLVDGSNKGWFNGIVNNFYQKRQKGDVLWDGAISANIDLMRLMMNPDNRHLAAGLAKGLGKGLWHLPGTLYNMTPIGKVTKLLGINKLAKNTVNFGRLAGNVFWNGMSASAGRMTKDIYRNATFKVGKSGAEKMARYAKNGVFNKKTFSNLANTSEKVSKITQLALKGVEKLGEVMHKIPGLGKLVDKIVDKFIPGIKKVCADLIKKISSKLTGKAAGNAAKKGFLGTIKGLLSSGVVTAVINIAFIAWDAWQGAKKAKEFFGISEDDNPTAIQKWACAITYAVLSLIECIPGCMIVTSIVSSLDFIMKWLCHKVYETLDECLTAIGCGESSEEKEEYQILVTQGDIDPATGQKFSSKGDAKGAYSEKQAAIEEQKQLAAQGYGPGGGVYSYGDSNDGWVRESGGQPTNELEDKFKYYAIQNGGETNTEEKKEEKKPESKQGGSGTGGRGAKTISGNPAKGNVPNFYSQDWLPAGKVGSLDIQQDGCALAVMKMIGSYKGLNIDDNTLINKMNQYKLANKSVSISFFSDFGGRMTSNRDDIKAALMSGSCCMALLIPANGYKHFVAVIAKDKGTVYVGDPMKSGWEELQNTNSTLYSSTIAASIFDGAIVTSIGLPAMKSTLGGGSTGGFGTKAREILFGNTNSNGNVISAGENMTNIFNNGYTGGNEWSRDGGETSTNSNGEGGGTSNGAVFSKDGILQPGVVQMPHGPVVEVLPGGGSMDTIVKYKDGTVAKRHGTVGFRNFNPDSHKKGSGWARSMFGAIDPPNGQYTLYPSPDHASAALKYMLFDKKDGTVWNNQSISSFVNLYLGGSAGGNVQQYINYVTKYSGKPASTVIGTLNPQERIGLMRGVRMAEIGVDSDESLKKFYAGGTQGNSETIMQQGAGGQTPKQGGNGGEVLYWGRGNIGFIESTFKDAHTTSRHVEKTLHFKHPTACGLAVGLTIQKLIYPSQKSQFTPNEIKAWGERTSNAFDKNYGVSQRFFKAMGLEYMDVNTFGKAGTVRVSHFLYGSTKIQSGEICVLGVSGGHWILIGRAGGNNNQIYISDPNLSRSVRAGSESKRLKIDFMVVDFAVHSVNGSSIVNILSRNGKSTHPTGMNNGDYSGKQVDNKTNGSATDPNGDVVNQDTNTTETNANQNGGSGAETKPNRGTSASFGGWFFKDKDGNIEQAFFGNLTRGGSRSAGPSGADSNANNTGGNQSGGTAGPAGPLGLPGSCDVMSDAKREDGGAVKESSPAYKAGLWAQKNKNGDLKGQCATGVSEALAAGFGGGRQQGNANAYHGRSGVLAPKTNMPHGKNGKYRAGSSFNSTDGQNASYMKKLGYHYISCTSKPQVGDVLVFTHPKDPGWIGHIVILCPDGKWRADGIAPGGDYFPYKSAGDRKESKYTLWRHKEEGLGGGDEDVLEYNSKSADNYYSKGSPSKSNTRKIVTRTIEEAKKIETSNDGVLVNEMKDQNGNTYKTFRIDNDPSRNASLAARDRMAKAKYDREMRKRNEGKNMKKFGMLEVTYTDKDDVVAKSLSTASGYIQDIHTDNRLIKIINQMAGTLADATVQNKIGTKKIIQEQEKQTEVLRDTIEATESIQENTEQSVKQNLHLIKPKTEPMTAEEIERNLSLIKQAEKEMFVGLNN